MSSKLITSPPTHNRFAYFCFTQNKRMVIRSNIGGSIFRVSITPSESENLTHGVEFSFSFCNSYNIFRAHEADLARFYVISNNILDASNHDHIVKNGVIFWSNTFSPFPDLKLFNGNDFEIMEPKKSSTFFATAKSIEHFMKLCTDIQNALNDLDLIFSKTKK